MRRRGGGNLHRKAANLYFFVVVVVFFGRWIITFQASLPDAQTHVRTQRMVRWGILLGNPLLHSVSPSLKREN